VFHIFGLVTLTHPVFKFHLFNFSQFVNLSTLDPVCFTFRPGDIQMPFSISFFIIYFSFYLQISLVIETLSLVFGIDVVTVA